MSDEIVEHRFVQIYQTCSSVSALNNTFWDTLANNTTIAIYHGCEKIYQRVTIEKNLDCFQTIQNFQNLILTNDDAAKINIFTRYITRLLIYNEQLNDKKIQFYHSKTDLYKLHPFTTIIKQKPAVYHNLLDQIDFLYKDGQQVLTILDGFISAIFLNEHQVDANAILTRFMNNIMLFASQDKSILTSIDEYFIQLLYKLPIHKEDSKYFILLDFLLWIHVSITPFSMFQVDSLKINKTDFLFVMLDRLLTASDQRNPIISHLTRLERVMQVDFEKETFDIIWATLSYSLLGSQSLEEQQLIVNLMKLIVDQNKCDLLILRVAYLPLYQLMSELNDKQFKLLKNKTLDLISYLDHHQSKASNASSIKKLQNIMNSSRIYGLLSHVFVYLYKLYNNTCPIQNDIYNTGPETTLAFNMLFCTPFAHDQKEDVQCLVFSRMAELSSIQRVCYKFPTFLFLLCILRSNSDNPRIVSHIFKDVIPTLADPNDPIMTSKVLQVILSSISSGNNSSMACLGVKALYHTYKIQPRVWQELKRVFSEWILRRKSVTLRRQVDLSNTGPIKMELAILTCMRDVCKERPRECAPDVLPMVISLLQSCQDISMASLSIMMATLNHCTKAGLVEPRSIWNVSVVYLAQYALDHGIKRCLLLVQQLCEFYSIAGTRNDVSEPYIQFKQSLLSDYISPLINDENAAMYAMKALSNFSAQDMAIILPEKAVEYIKQITPEADSPNANQHLVLTTLVSNELDHMRRGLFKEENKQQSAVDVALTNTKIIKNDAGHVVGEQELEVQTKFTELWESARIAPGLRSGYAIAMLHTIDLASTQKIKDKQETWAIVSKSKWYRFMMTQFTDIALTDHLMLRISSVGSWETFFRNALLMDVENDIEVIVTLLIQDLSKKLESSTVPGITCNIMLAITGLVNALYLFIPSFAASCASNVIEKLLENYIHLAGSPLSHSAHLMSEEVQFAARFALGYLGPCVISNEKLVHIVHENLIESATNQHAKYRNIDTTVDLVQYANGFSAGHFVAALCIHPTMTETIETVRDTSLQALLDYCSTQTISDSRIMGILMGLASGLKSDIMNKELSFAIESLKIYLGGESINKGRLLGSLWLCALGAKQEGGVDYEISSLVESALASASNDPNLAQHFYHFTICYAQIQYHSYLLADPSNQETEEFYRQAFEPLMHSIDKDEASSNYRIASLFGIGCLFGVNYIYNHKELIYLESQRYVPESRKAPLGKVSFVAGIGSRSAPTGNLKSGRIAAAVCGKMIEHVILLQRVLESDGQSKSESLSLLSASSEPANYNRLNSNTSYLRAIFDQLVKITGQENTVQKNNIGMLLKSLIKTPGPLPSVNWFNLLLKIIKLSPELNQLCFSLASTHASTSFSLSEFLMTQMSSLFKNINLVTTSIDFMFLEEGAFSTILELSGLPNQSRLNKNGEQNKRRGMNAVVKKISISDSRVLELIQLISQKFEILQEDTQYNFLSRIADHVSNPSLDEDKLKLVTSIREQIYNSVTIVLLNNKKDDKDWILEKAIECSLMDIGQLLTSGRLEDWKEIPTDLVFNRIVSLCEFYRLQTATKKQDLIKYISTAITHLISLPIEISHTSWLVIADTISEDCQSDKDVLGWVIRVLDAFVVYISAFNTPQEYNDNQLVQSIQIGLRSILVELRSSPDDVPVVEIELADTVYLLSCILSIGDKIQQEQIVKRVFKLMDMVKKLKGSSSVDFFNLVSLSFPQEYLVQYENKY